MRQNFCFLARLASELQFFQAENKLIAFELCKCLSKLVEKDEDAEIRYLAQLTLDDVNLNIIEI